jgi:hypothetical protein
LSRKNETTETAVVHPNTWELAALAALIEAREEGQERIGDSADE